MKKHIIILIASSLLFACSSEDSENKSENKGTKNDSEEQLDDSKDSKDNKATSSAIGYAVEIVIGTDKYDESIEYYETLGWELYGDEINMGGKMQRMYDGSMMIAIAEDTMKYMGPSFHTESQETFADLANLNEIMSFKNGDDIAMAVYAAPDSLDFAVSSEGGEFPENKNTGVLWEDMDLSKLEFPNKACGTHQEFSVSVEDLNASIAYWEKLGFTHKGINEGAPYNYTIMFDGKFILGLHETKGMWHGNHITYSGHGETNVKTAEAIRELGYAVEELEYGGQVLENNFIFEDPNGNTFYLFTDFAQ